MPLSADTPAPVRAITVPGRSSAARQAASTACMATMLLRAPGGDAVVAGSDQHGRAGRWAVEAELLDAEPARQAAGDPAEAVACVDLAQRMQPLGAAVAIDEGVDRERP